MNGATGSYGGAAALVALAMGAGRVLAAGRNADKLSMLVRLAGKAVVPMALSGDLQKDVTALREAAGGGAEIAFEMLGGQPTRVPCSRLSFHFGAVAGSFSWGA